ncbi:MAG: hypothetical protein HOP29_04280 [Phycisphaerales bacterium]|nr:hypothetical protein [Phycisphaerales bacterium]
MAAPRDIVDALECVLSVYFSGVRHNLRAAFILCDGLVELTCKVKAEAGGWRPFQINFVPLLKLGPVSLDPASSGLGRKCEDTHKVRNKMHHVNAVATVDAQYCADSILDAVDCIEHCFPGAKAAFEDKIKVALRVVRVYSVQGSGAQRTAFQDSMSRYKWRARKNPPRVNEIVVSPGLRPHWGMVIMDTVADIETILNRIGAPQ